jgi:NAD(P)-dependent dehydrogenase (short-subunit alcohol dehydrogenase family)
VFGYINMTRAFYATMKKKGGGVIINILGAAGERLESNYIAGSTANAGLMAFTKSMGSASPADNICVVGINPGPIATDRLETIMQKRAQDLLGAADFARLCAAAVRARRETRGDRIHGCFPGVRFVRLHDRNGNHHRCRRREQGKGELAVDRSGVKRLDYFCCLQNGGA